MGFLFYWYHLTLSQKYDEQNEKSVRAVHNCSRLRSYECRRAILWA